MPPTLRLSTGPNLGRKDPRVACAGIAKRTEESCFREARGAEFIEEGTAFLGSGNSGEPIGLRRTDFGGKRLFEDQFGDER